MKIRNAAHTWRQTSRPTSRGFTFIEVLVVSVLIALLATIAMVSYAGASQKTRDSRRKKDINNLRASLEMYRQAESEYPTGLNLLEPDYVDNLNGDPRLSQGWPDYTYDRLTTTTYRLYAILENENDADANGASYGYSEAAYVVTQPQ